MADSISRLSSHDGLASNVADNRYVKLNVGGTLFHTTIDTLSKHDSMLRAMFSGRVPVVKDEDGWVLIDRSGKHFAAILDFLRDGSIPIPDCRVEVEQIKREAQYYCLQDLIVQCQTWLDAHPRFDLEMPLIHRVPTVYTRQDAEALIKQSNRPVIKLFINRHNNKYSYTINSDDNILKNQELFDRLVCKFHDRILFVKDVGSESTEVCQWKFYGKRILRAEVCCTSIVYATDKKHTKVEFPDSKIYDEAMSILCFEDRGLCARCGENSCLSRSPSTFEPNLAIYSNIHAEEPAKIDRD
ncbi:hypothetical protein PENTCL1PPCAC_10408 [Pristionchus entomophagus]|uniref:BTB domain-containing protein n=1 Tax=Pristionchus entomophagus TaxID=358040 RepID=A0AAV5SYT4_9BILA|nr:hypothetical protein PENTCL1PPCAC_10408 [Pristionchus entomophagus]